MCNYFQILNKPNKPVPCSELVHALTSSIDEQVYSFLVNAHYCASSRRLTSEKETRLRQQFHHNLVCCIIYVY